MRSFLTKWILNVLAFYLAAQIVPGMKVADLPAVVSAGLVLGLIHLFLRPLFLLVALPVNLLTLGLFTLMIDTWLVIMTAHLASGIFIPGFWEAFMTALIITGINLLLRR